MLARDAWLVSAKGGTLTVIRDGEVLFECAVPPGRVSAREFSDLVPDGCEVELSGGLVAIEPRGLSSVVAVKDRYATDANPDFQPTPVDPLQRQLRAMVAELQERTKTQEARLARLMEVQELPRGRAAQEAPQQEAPVVE